MKMIIVTQCCCGCTVRTGSLIIGILCGISALLDFIYEMAVLSSMTEVDKDHAHPDEHRGTDYTMSKGELIAVSVFTAIQFAACVSLIYGILKERLKFISVWIYVYIVVLVLVVLYIAQIVIVVIIHTERVHQLWEIPAVVIMFAISSYCIVVVNSHYLNLKDGVTLPPRPPLIITV